MTKSGIHRDPRDTARRRVRHRDQTLLRAGMGLTTGLGWSDRCVPLCPFSVHAASLPSCGLNAG